MTEDQKGREGCELHQFERNNYFFGKLMTVRDFQDEQAYFNGKRYLLNRHIHGWGIICGFQNIQIREGPSGEIIATFCDGGAALDCCGREIVVPVKGQKKVLDISGNPLKFDQEAGNTLCLYLKYRECYRERVEAASSSSGCEPVCCWNRILEDYEVIGLLPNSMEKNEPVKQTKVMISQENQGTPLPSLQQMIKENSEIKEIIFKDLSAGNKRILTKILTDLTTDPQNENLNQRIMRGEEVESEEIDQLTRENQDVRNAIVRLFQETRRIYRLHTAPCHRDYSHPCLENPHFSGFITNYIKQCHVVQTLNCPDCCVYLGIIRISSDSAVLSAPQSNECEPVQEKPERTGGTFSPDETHRRYVYSNPLLAELICKSQQPQEQATICVGGVCPLVINTQQKDYKCTGIELGKDNEIVGWSIQLGIELQWPTLDLSKKIPETHLPSDESGLALEESGLIRAETKSIKYSPELAILGISLFGNTYKKDNKWLLDISLGISDKMRQIIKNLELFNVIVHWWAITPQNAITCTCAHQKLWPVE
ncbi:MAG: hypothetical protein APR53_02880 [Methanoculleus sp. SDB]|nr:MAG: hypothetical protein APR53_02880 [Methanoculleus sp. SDB]